MGLALIAMALLVMTWIGQFTRSFTRSLAPRHSTSVYERERQLEEIYIERKDSENKIAVIEVQGVITSADGDHSGMNMVESIKEQLKSANRDSAVKAVVLKVNSPGGEVLASDDIAQAITKFQNASNKPVVVSMGTLAASGGYYISAPCRWIVANELTITGSIGVIMHGYNFRGLLNKVGIQPQVFKSGKFKDMLSGDREPDITKLSPEDREIRKQEDDMVQGLITETYEKFKTVVRTGRNKAAKENGEDGNALDRDWEDAADGRVFSGKQALELGFVDELGGFETAVKRAESLTHIRDASLVEYHQMFDISSLFRLFGKTEAPAIKVDLGVDAPRLQAGQMYFIAPTVVP